jgi:hypothetical protein
LGLKHTTPTILMALVNKVLPAAGKNFVAEKPEVNGMVVQ